MEQARKRSDFVRLYAYGGHYRLIYFKHPVKFAGIEEKEQMFDSSQGFVEKVEKDAGGERLENNIIRARSTVQELALCNPWDYFVTLTLSPEKYDRYNLGQYQRDLSQWLRNQRRLHGGAVRYLLIPEQHKDGAWHMHGLLYGVPRERLARNANGFLEWSAYARKFGFMGLGMIRDPVAVSRYITKYITKDFGGAVKESGAHLYYASQGLKRREVIAEGIRPEGVSWQYENEWMKSAWISEADAKRLRVEWVR